MPNWFHLIFALSFPTLCTPSLVIVGNKSDSRTIDGDSSLFPTLNITSSEKLRLQRVYESRFGVKQILVVRVSSLQGETPIESLDEIEAAVYGTGPNPMNVPADSSVVAQFRAVSHGRLVYEPIIVPNLTRHGLLDIVIEESTLNANISSTTRFDTIVRPAMMNEVTRILGESIFGIAHRILFCMPSGSLDRSIAGIGEVGGMFTFYHLGYCRKLDAMMHELGHNLNFHHSGIGTLEYGDMSDYMGGLEVAKQLKKKSKFGFLKEEKASKSSPIDGAGYPRKAFNGHKQWYSGWFQDRAVEVYPLLYNGIIQNRIVSFVEYSNPHMHHEDLVQLKCGTLFIQYNRAKGYNVDSSEPDRVTISEGFVDGGLSKRVASLGSGEKYLYPNFDGSGKELVIQVCGVTADLLGVIDYADVRVYINDGPVKLICPVETNGKNDWIPDTFLSGIIEVEEPFRSVFSIFVFTFLIFTSTVLFLLCCCGVCHCYTTRKAGNKVMKNNTPSSNCSETDIDETVTDMEATPL
jgi:Gametolysin peptidase M11